ncbi:MAG: hypothetical protein ACFFD1_02600 [Candidatus Thorarchaeota archaeon]
MLPYQEKERTLTIQKRKLKKHWFYNTCKIVPEIRIGGLWLAERGFNPKDKIRVIVRESFIAIEPTV